MPDSGLLAASLGVAVPLLMMGLKARGGPNAEDWDQARAFGAELAEHGDVLLFGSKKPGEAADLFNGLARSVAVLAFLPGGVTILGEHYEAEGRI